MFPLRLKAIVGCLIGIRHICNVHSLKFNCGVTPARPLVLQACFGISRMPFHLYAYSSYCTFVDYTSPILFYYFISSSASVHPMNDGFTWRSTTGVSSISINASTGEVVCTPFTAYTIILARIITTGIWKKETGLHHLYYMFHLRCARS